MEMKQTLCVIVIVKRLFYHKRPKIKMVTSLFISENVDPASFY